MTEPRFDCYACGRSLCVSRLEIKCDREKYYGAFGQHRVPISISFLPPRVYVAFVCVCCGLETDSYVEGDVALKVYKKARDVIEEYLK